MCGFLIATPAHGFDRIDQALDRMSYRGKEGRKGAVIRGGLVLGHVRLAIQDLSEESDQPYSGDRHELAFVGEIFNVTEGRSELEYLNEVYTEQGARGLHNLDGFWSIAVLHNGRASVFTDHLGIKPVYFWPEKSIVCSELEPMFVLEDRPKLDEVYLANCIKFGYDYSGRTPYEGIKQLAPGSRLTVTPMGMSIESYWNWDLVPFLSPEVKNFRTVIDQAIRSRLVGDREVALLVSGGLDSSIIYYSLKSQGQKVRGFSVENGESEFLPPGITTLPVEEVTLEDAVRIMQAPVDLGSLLPQIQLARALKGEGFNVCLTGDGADELFGGYRRSREYDSQASDVFCELPYYHLPRLDRVMMHETVEQRSPFLAPSVIAMALRLPKEHRTTKQVLKAAYFDLVPERVLYRDKKPLKSQAVINGGISHRSQLVEVFRAIQKSLSV